MTGASLGARAAALLVALLATGVAGQTSPEYSQRAYSLRMWPADSVLADVNGDTILDFITVGKRESSALPPVPSDDVTIHLGLGDGSFSRHGWRRGLEVTAGAVSGDFDEDGIEDVALCGGSAHADPRTLLVLRGTRAGVLEETWSDQAGLFTEAIDAGDMNGDGHLDLIVIQVNGEERHLVVHLGAGDGTFPTRLVHASADARFDVDVADFDGDSRLDVLAPVKSGGLFSPPEEYVRTVSLFRGLGNGLLEAGQSIAPELNLYPERVEPGDVDGNGRPDFMIFDSPPRLFINNGDGSFVSPSPTSAGPPSLLIDFLAFHDFDGDGLDDLLANASFTGWESYRGARIWWAGDEDVLLPSLEPFSSGRIGADIHFGDLDCDGSTDVVATGPGAHFVVVMGESQAGLQRETSIDLAQPTGFEPSLNPQVLDVVAADMDLDGIDDIVAAVRRIETFPQGSLITVVRGGAFLPPASAPEDWSTLVMGHPSRIAVGRLNADAWPDVVMIDGVLEKLKQLNGLGGGILNSPIVREVDGIPVDVALADMDGDHDDDIVLLTTAPNRIRVLSNEGASVFEAIDVVPLAVPASQLIVEDIDGDGHTDVAIRRHAQSDLAFFSGSSTGELSTVHSVPFPGNITTALLHDIDQDGHLDALAAHWSTTEVFIRWGLGNWAFEDFEAMLVSESISSLAVADVNADGATDIAVSHGHGIHGHVSILLGRRNRRFAPAVMFRTIPGAYPIAAGDVDADGVPDLVTGGRGFVGLLLDLPDRAWNNLGHPLPLAPHLPHLCGAPDDGNTATLGYELTDAPPLARTSLFLSPRRGDTPLHGGTLVPTPALILDVGATSAHGALAIDLPIPPGLAPGADLYAQAWLQSGGACAASNALVTTLP